MKFVIMQYSTLHCEVFVICSGYVISVQMIMFNIHLYFFAAAKYNGANGNGETATHEDELGDNFIGVRRRIRHIIATRQKTIEILRKKAAIADKIHRGCSQSNRNANITGAFGGTLALLGGGITFFSGGLAAPVVIAGLGDTGALCSVGGGAWSIWNEYDRSQRGSAIQQELLQQLEEDEEARIQLDDILKSIENGDFGEPQRVLRQLHTFVAGLGGVGIVFGSTAPIDVLRLALPPLAYFISGKTNVVLLSILQYLPLIAGKGCIIRNGGGS